MPDTAPERGDKLADTTGNLPPMAGIHPDYPAPIIRHGPQGGWQLTKARRDMPTPQMFLKDNSRQSFGVITRITQPMSSFTS